ncbi:hypothetical protein C0992_001186 [Termitomyces sp. T32_za158]|nr:hypothetical protein C0992_001186 [Termitomyces sp. T32_za158]
MLGRAVGSSESCSFEEGCERAKALVFEDGVPGMQAGKRAGMSGIALLTYLPLLFMSLAVIWVPDANLLDVDYTGKERADQILKSIEDFVPQEWGLPPYDS